MYTFCHVKLTNKTIYSKIFCPALYCGEGENYGQYRVMFLHELPGNIWRKLHTLTSPREIEPVYACAIPMMLSPLNYAWLLYVKHIETLWILRIEASVAGRASVVGQSVEII